MRRRPVILIGAMLLALAGCAPATPLPTFTPIPAPTLPPSPTPLPSPTLTATPIPPLVMTLLWPQAVSALEPVVVEVALASPPGIETAATIAIQVFDPEGVPYRAFDLSRREGDRYASDESLDLPLLPLDGEWLLAVDVQSELPVEGQRWLAFPVTPIRFRDLSNVLPAGVDVRVPEAFEEAVALGDQVAGARVWRHGGGEVSLWWAPGPAEPLLLNNALVMLETTHGAVPPAVGDAEEIVWQDQAAFLFRETWPGADGGPGEALVVQGPDLWLYVLRVRAMGSEAIPALMRQVWETFAFNRS